MWAPPPSSSNAVRHAAATRVDVVLTVLADSVTLDPHKGMFLPYGTGSLIVRNAGALRDAHYAGAAYLQDRAPDGELPNLSEYSTELSRDHRGGVGSRR